MSNDYTFQPIADDLTDFSTALAPVATVAPAPAPDAAPLVAIQQQAAAMPAPVPPAGAPRARAGLSIVLAGTAAVVGGWAGGWYGAGAGVLLMGSLRNVQNYHASLSAPQGSEDWKSLTMAVIGAAGGGYLGYRAYKQKRRIP